MPTILDEIEDFLQRPLITDKTKLSGELSVISELRLKLVDFQVSAHVQVLQETARYRRPVEKGLTDFDRRILLNDLIADTQAIYERSEALSELLSDRRADLLALYRS